MKVAVPLTAFALLLSTQALAADEDVYDIPVFPGSDYYAPADLNGLYPHDFDVYRLRIDAGTTGVYFGICDTDPVRALYGFRSGPILRRGWAPD